MNINFHLIDIVPQTHPMFFEVLHWADVVNLVVVCQQTEAFSPLLRKYFLMRQSLGSILESESVSDVFDYWSAIALPHVAFIAFILTLSALCLHCVNIVSTLFQHCVNIVSTLCQHCVNNVLHLAHLFGQFLIFFR